MTKILLTLLALTLTIPNTFGMGKRPEKNRLTFHVEAEKIDNPKMVFPLQMGNRKRVFQKSGLTSTKEIISFKHFITEDGTYGAVFTFSKAAANRIAAITTQNQGKWLVGMLNGNAVDGVYIDGPIRDGKIVVWRGIKQVEIIRFEYAMPITGETKEAWKERIKSHEFQRKAAQELAREKKKAKRIR